MLCCHRHAPVMRWALPGVRAPSPNLTHCEPQQTLSPARPWLHWLSCWGSPGDALLCPAPTWKMKFSAGGARPQRMKTAVERAKLLRSVHTLPPGLSMHAEAHIPAGVEVPALPSPPCQVSERCQPPLAASPCCRGTGSAACTSSCLLPCTPWRGHAACTALLPITRVPCESKERGRPYPFC